MLGKAKETNPDRQVRVWQNNRGNLGHLLEAAILEIYGSHPMVPPLTEQESMVSSRIYISLFKEQCTHSREPYGYSPSEL